jgi:hypothetical protein
VDDLLDVFLTAREHAAVLVHAFRREIKSSPPELWRGNTLLSR